MHAWVQDKIAYLAYLHVPVERVSVASAFFATYRISMLRIRNSYSWPWISFIKRNVKLYKKQAFLRRSIPFLVKRLKYVKMSFPLIRHHCEITSRRLITAISIAARTGNSMTRRCSIGNAQLNIPKWFLRWITFIAQVTIVTECYHLTLDAPYPETLPAVLGSDCTQKSIE